MPNSDERTPDSQPSHSAAEPPGDTQSTNPNRMIGDGDEITEASGHSGTSQAADPGE